MSTPRAYGEGKDVRLAFRVTPELKKDLDKWAAHAGLSLSKAMEQALKDWIAKQKWLDEHDGL